MTTPAPVFFRKTSPPFPWLRTRPIFSFNAAKAGEPIAPRPEQGRRRRTRSRDSANAPTYAARFVGGGEGGRSCEGGGGSGGGRAVPPEPESVGEREVPAGSPAPCGGLLLSVQ